MALNNFYDSDNPLQAERGRTTGAWGADPKPQQNVFAADSDTIAAEIAAKAPKPRDSSYYDQMRARQQALIDRLHGIASGQVKSPAQEIYEQQVQQVQNQNVGTSASLRDVGPGGQAQIAAQNRGMIQGQGREQGAILQSQQRQQAEYALAQLYEQQRQGDMAYAAGESDQILGNRQLDDFYNNTQILRQFGVNAANTGRATSRATSDLGLATANASNAGRVGLGLAQAGAAGFDYLGRAANGGGGGGASSGPSLSDMNKPGYGWGGPGA